MSKKVTKVNTLKKNNTRYILRISKDEKKKFWRQKGTSPKFVISIGEWKGNMTNAELISIWICPGDWLIAAQYNIWTSVCILLTGGKTRPYFTFLISWIRTVIHQRSCYTGLVRLPLVIMTLGKKKRFKAKVLVYKPRTH